MIVPVPGVDIEQRVGQVPSVEVDGQQPGVRATVEIDRDMENPRALAMAALSICESMLLSLEDRGLIDADERRNLLEDVTETHLNVAAQGGDPLLHKAVARIARDMRVGTHLATKTDATPGSNGSRR